MLCGEWGLSSTSIMIKMNLLDSPQLHFVISLWDVVIFLPVKRSSRFVNYHNRVLLCSCYPVGFKSCLLPILAGTSSFLCTSDIDNLFFLGFPDIIYFFNINTYIHHLLVCHIGTLAPTVFWSGTARIKTRTDIWFDLHPVYELCEG